MTGSNYSISNSATLNYASYMEFLETYACSGFQGIDRESSFIKDLERILEINDQFFMVGDLISMNFPFTSKRSLDMIGVDSSTLSPYHLFQATHPCDMPRHSRARAHLLKLTQELFSSKKGSHLLSANFMTRNREGSYENILKQAYLFYSDLPYSTVFIFLLHTNINMFRKKDGFHYYSGNDISMFRLPDEELLAIGPPFSHREFEIITLIESGMSSETIGEKLFISPHTVNTHRRNILRKTGHAHISELIYSLQKNGLM